MYLAHLPPRRVQLVRRYGVYAGKGRKQWQERPNIYCLAPESWQKGHPREPKIVQTILQENTKTVQAPDSWSKLHKQSWARLLQKVYEVLSALRFLLRLKAGLRLPWLRRSAGNRSMNSRFLICLTRLFAQNARGQCRL